MDPVLITALTGAASSIVAVIGATVVPIYSAHRKHKDEMEMYDKKFMVERRVVAIETYLENVGRAVLREREPGKSVSQALSSVYIYAPKDLWEQIDEMNQTVLQMERDPFNDYTRSLAQQKHLALCKAFSVIADSLPKQSKQSQKRNKKRKD